VLVRPELALIGGLALIMMLVTAQGWRRRVTIVVAGGLLPGPTRFSGWAITAVVPGTALAKDAAGDKWSQGVIYLSNFNEPYLVVGAGTAAAGLGLVLWASARRRRGIHVPSSTRGPLAARCRARRPS